MANLDTTRHPGSPPPKHYVGARMQQGRSVLDSDWNEDAGLRAEDIRQTFVELLGATGSSNAGFSVGDIDTFVLRTTADGSVVTTYDFQLRPGSLWIGGLRFTVEGEETFLSQLDWLQIDASATNLPSQPTAQELLGPPPNGALIHIYKPGLVASQRLDLVYVEGWEQPVTAVEDSELRERALGGPDTSARIRRMRRIHVLPHLISNTGNGALMQLGAYLTNGYSGNAEVSLGTYDTDTFELVSAARLTVVPITEAGNQPCGPTPPRGYTGHEDQAIRVELRGSTSLVWGFGNVAPLYRARIGAGGVITLLSRPRDPNRHPQAGQIAELIPWGSKLPNDEKAAECTGHLVRISGSYKPATGELELAENPPATLVAWLDEATQHHRSQDVEPKYVYVRIWDRGADVTSDTVIEARGSVVQLGHTGLQLTLEGAGRSGDYWIIAARRQTPELVVPWQLLTSEAPHGPRRFYAPLAILTWEAPLQFMSYAKALNELTGGTYLAVPHSATAAIYGPVVAKVTDLRRPLARLCIRGCATILVGDGDTSFGMVDSLSDALALLPSSGGRIQLLRGLHRVDEVIVVGRSNITICGCGPESKLDHLDDPISLQDFIGAQRGPVLTFQKCEGIVLENFTIVGMNAVGVKLDVDLTGSNRNIRISRMQFEMDGEYDPGDEDERYALSQPGILALDCDGLTIERCRVQHTATLNYSPGMVVGGSNMVVRDNEIYAGDIDDSTLAESMGGLHILSFSQNVEVSGNVIRGGWGYGIALGHLLDSTTFYMSSVEDLDAKTSWIGLTLEGRSLGDVISNMHKFRPTDTETETLGATSIWTPGGPVIDVCIRDNRILGKGFSGISTGGFARFDDPRTRFINVINADIQRNEIVGNLRVSELDAAALSQDYVCVGGICLAASINAQIRENIIANNGSNFEIPTVGVGFITAQGAVVQDNIIVDNGPPVDAANTPLLFEGLRGGIVALEVTPVRPVNIPDSLPDIEVQRPEYTTRTNKVALTVRNNEVRQRTGKTLWVRYGFGPMVVAENSLHGFGDPVTSLVIDNSKLSYADGGGVRFTYPAQGACVEIRNYGYSPAVEYDGVKQAMKYGDLATPTISGGLIDFCRNEVALEWEWIGGYAASVVLSSLDSVKVTDNVMRAVMGNNFEPMTPPPAQSFLISLFGEEIEEESFLVVNCWAGAASSVQASGNRFEEPLFDCVFSYLGAHAAAFGDGDSDTTLTQVSNAAVMMMNVGSHCLIGPDALPPGSPIPDNVAIHQVVAGCSRTAKITDGTEQIVTIQHL